MLGFAAACKHEAAFRQEAAIGLVLAPLAFWLGISVEQRLLLLGSLLLVLITEILNSGIEAVVDRIGPEFHELSGRAKDLGAAAVFLSLCWVGITWGMIIWSRFG